MNQEVFMPKPEQGDTPEQVSSWPPIVYHILPSGFCAGIVRTERGLDMVGEMYPGQEKILVGAPAHNPTVIQKYEQKGWKMVDSVDDVPNGTITAFGPHGSTAEDRKTAKEKGLSLLDTECPLVTDVRTGVETALREGRTVILWGKKGHAETRAHLGVDAGEFDEEARKRLLLGQSPEEILSDEFLKQIEDPKKVAFYAQTTHNADEALKIRSQLSQKFPHLTSLKTEGICYATRDRQFGVKEMKRIVETLGIRVLIIVAGDIHTSSNTRELYELTGDENRQLGIAALNADQLEEHKQRFPGYDAIAVTAGASAPDADIIGILKWCEANGSKLETLQLGRDESNINFKLPPIQNQK